MNIADLTPEQVKKIEEAASVDELAGIAEAEGVSATEEELEAAWNQFHAEGGKFKLSEEELDNVAGGCMEDDHYDWINAHHGQTWEHTGCCPVCGASTTLEVTMSDGCYIRCTEYSIRFCSYNENTGVHTVL